METNRNLTVGEVVEMTIRTLSNISVPVSLMGQIGLPISQAVNNLQKIQEAWKKEAEMEEQEEAEPDKPEQGETESE